VVVRSTDGRVLLFRGGDPARPEAGTWWVTPGGGVDPGETTADAARRELLEETGLAAGDLGPVRMHRTTTFEFNGVTYRQKEDYFLIEGPPFDVDTSRWSPLERASVVESRWWPIDELRTTDEVVYPEELVALAEGRTVRRRDLARIAVWLIALCSLLALLNGAGAFVERTLEVRAFSDPNQVQWTNPFPIGLSLALLFLWITSWNFATAGVVMGVVTLLRNGWRQLWRAVLLVVVVVGGTIAEMAGMGFSTDPDPPDAPDPSGFVHDGRLGGLLTAAVAVAVVVLSAWLLLTSSGSARRRGRSSASPSPPGGTAP
jgi:8-oxo-dGTP pyrophosphatase MutT (NUDIX family)